MKEEEEKEGWERGDQWEGIKAADAKFRHVANISSASVISFCRADCQSEKQKLELAGGAGRGQG